MRFHRVPYSATMSAWVIQCFSYPPNSLSVLPTSRCTISELLIHVNRKEKLTSPPRVKYLLHCPIRTCLNKAMLSRERELDTVAETRAVIRAVPKWYLRPSATNLASLLHQNLICRINRLESISSLY